MAVKRIGTAARVRPDLPAKVMRFLENALILSRYSSDADRQVMYQFIQRVAQAWGGQCLSDAFPGSKTPMHFTCARDTSSRI